jgi:putative FmdB family regulatory protein
MPTYDYECTKCGNEFEAFQKMTDNHLSKCPKCSGKVKRLIGAGSGIIFKGSGFYETDYKKKKHPAADSSKDKICPKIKEGCDGCKAR